MAKNWTKYSGNQSFNRTLAELKNDWASLHQGDREPFPDGKWVASLPSTLFSGDAEAAAKQLQEAWAAFHAGDFETAWNLGNELGTLGGFVANKAAGIHATYLVAGESAQLKWFEEIAERAEECAEAWNNHANNHYIHAFALGRYSQRISIAKALAQGLATKVRNCLDRTLELEPNHADAHTALGLFHAEIVSQVGGMIAKMTYGANAKSAQKYLEQAVSLAPDAPITTIELANGLLLLDEDKHYDRASELYEEALDMEPRDAMDALDIAQASEMME